MVLKGEPPRAIQVDDTELSMMKVTRPEFERWPKTIERQSNMTARQGLHFRSKRASWNGGNCRAIHR